MDETTLRQIIREEVARILGGAVAIASEQPLPNEKWLPTAQAAKALNMSRSTLDKWREVWKSGIHYRSKSPPGALTQHWEFNITKCQEELAKPPEKRKAG